MPKGCHADLLQELATSIEFALDKEYKLARYGSALFEGTRIYGNIRHSKRPGFDAVRTKNLGMKVLDKQSIGQK